MKYNKAKLIYRLYTRNNYFYTYVDSSTLYLDLTSTLTLNLAMKQLSTIFSIFNASARLIVINYGLDYLNLSRRLALLFRTSQSYRNILSDSILQLILKEYISIPYSVNRVKNDRIKGTIAYQTLILEDLDSSYLSLGTLLLYSETRFTPTLYRPLYYLALEGILPLLSQ